MYIKLLDNQALTYFREDFFYLKELTQNVSFQPLSENENKEFKTLFYIFGNSKNNTLKVLRLDFDFEKSILTIDNKKSFNIVANYEFTVKKSRGNNILANGGIKGIYEFIFESMNIEKSAFSSWTFYALNGLIKKY
jgi:hypothetical protein